MEKEYGNVIYIMGYGHHDWATKELMYNMLDSVRELNLDLAEYDLKMEVRNELQDIADFTDFPNFQEVTIGYWKLTRRG